MANKKIEEALKKLQSAIIIDDVSSHENIGALKTLSFGKHKLVIKTLENRKQYTEALNVIYNWILIKEIDISYNFIEKSICKLLIAKTENLLTVLLDNISTLALKDYYFIRPMFGLILERNTIIEKGKYKFISKRYIKEHLESHCQQTSIIDTCFEHSITENLCYIEMECNAKDFDKANERANSTYKQLDNVLRFMFGNNDKNMGLGVFDYRVDINGEMFCKCSEGEITTSVSLGVTSPVRPISFDANDWFFNKDNGNEKIWTILNASPCNEIERRIIKSIEWIGMAINQSQPSISFIQCIFAIECLLQEQEGFITKSITAQISEYAAFIVGYDKESKKEIEGLFKKLYEIRSKIAHGTYVNSLSIELTEAIWLSKQIVINFLIKPGFKSIENMSSLRKYITELRYS